MRSTLISFLAFMGTVVSAPDAQAQHAIIPKPVSYTSSSGVFVMDGSVAIVSRNQELNSISTWFVKRMQASGINLKTATTATGRSIEFILLTEKDQSLGQEGYTLQVTPASIKVAANQPGGIFYGLQTLMQLMPAYFEARSGANGAYTIPACSITDYPRFGWRGLMLDVSRNFMTVADVKAYIDLMARYKFNVFHWHLTDDEGWRIEIKSLPKLTSVGACRVPRNGIWGEREAPKPGEAATDCGFYTQEEVKDIVAYAAQKHITVVPEIDVPGHSSAAIAAYPELSITHEQVPVSPGYKFSEWYGDGTFKMLVDNTLNPADEKVYEFLDKVFGEVAQLFPGQYIHSGGDECYHGYWEKSPEVQKFMKAKGIKDSHGLQSYFTGRVNDIIKSKGKSMIGWDEILEGGLVEGAAVMSWRGMKGGVEAAKLGHKVVMTPTTFAYLDYMQGDPLLEPRIYASLSLKKSYEFEPVPDGVNAELILGGQGNLWAEKVPHYRHATYMTYPRAWALADILWSPASSKNWSDFIQRVDRHFERADAAGVKVSKALYDVRLTAKKAQGSLEIGLENDHPNAVVYYTLDNSLPDQHAQLYTGPVLLPRGPITVQAVAYINGKQAGRIIKADYTELQQRSK